MKSTPLPPILKTCIHYGNDELHYASRQGRCIKCCKLARRGARMPSPRGPGRPPRDDGLKRCPACRTTKPLDQFAESATSRDGRRYRCLDCDRARNSSVLFCEQCCGLAHRRKPGEVCRCGGVYAPLETKRAESEIRSSAGTWEVA